MLQEVNPVDLERILKSHTHLSVSLLVCQTLRRGHEYRLHCLVLKEVTSVAVLPCCQIAMLLCPSTDTSGMCNVRRMQQSI